mmetsp:Transcript_8724/g.12106  ORF Transcript_8724/g.12106 Transcript_8724/m.12106 type:complete len:230 (-) Transcript_8724:238-927(-)
MADSWEDDDFEPQLPVLNKAPTSWEDEEEEDEEETVRLPQKPTLSEATRKRLEAKAEAEKQAKLDSMLEENETAEDRKLRERRVVEEGDNELTNELFGASPGAVDPDAVVIKLKDLKDHLQLVQTLNDKMSKSKNNHIVAFTKEFLRSNETVFEATDLTDMITILTNQKETKLKAQRKPTVSKKEQKSKKQTKKEQLEAQRRAEENFGAASGGDKYDEFDYDYDATDFM